jgi:hypothetical protein
MRQTLPSDRNRARSVHFLITDSGNRPSTTGHDAQNAPGNIASQDAKMIFIEAELSLGLTTNSLLCLQFPVGSVSRRKMISVSVLSQTTGAEQLTKQ